jgi:hypothetical protein
VVAAAVAVPALPTVAGGEHGDRRRAPGLGVQGVRARPTRRLRSPRVGAEELVGEGRQVDRGEDGVTVEPDPGRRRRGCAHTPLGPSRPRNLSRHRQLFCSARPPGVLTSRSARRTVPAPSIGAVPRFIPLEELEKLSRADLDALLAERTVTDLATADPALVEWARAHGRRLLEERDLLDPTQG